ncbi:hypothetical protein, partial [Enterococcus faecium]|uniref:hypothetical protein n=1 Tax=Enterococcus faecium TaxID=1352 RepID=UPI0027E41839
SSFLLLSFSIILPYLIVDLKLCNRTLMSMNLTKLALEARRKVETFQHKSVKNKNRDETITFMIISSRFLFLELVISQQLFHFLGIFPLGAYF